MDALLAVPNPKQRQGLRDFALLLFLYNLDSDGFSLPVMPPIRRGLGPRRAT